MVQGLDRIVVGERKAPSSILSQNRVGKGHTVFLKTT
eukprot:CAMPEP_0117072424 /NCGR_PEP_ID=MMETSP0472-20121206/50981_1 /TAXON_ID=693140 ORGANISM="Tiarina fusus, Strain LIS" /NCGR_SAMPLE_ID=MMETSP0472 /ASSEMBLY_ACC=CAM_ASM_000603 /LENGTH=36 /DNA_ID= /DNA_START= /DNA_END= /DNA_ORIENTATION=